MSFFLPLDLFFCRFFSPFWFDSILFDLIIAFFLFFLPRVCLLSDHRQSLMAQKAGLSRRISWNSYQCQRWFISRRKTRAGGQTEPSKEKVSNKTMAPITRPNRRANRTIWTKKRRLDDAAPGRRPRGGRPPPGATSPEHFLTNCFCLFAVFFLNLAF